MDGPHCILATEQLNSTVSDMKIDPINGYDIHVLNIECILLSDLNISNIILLVLLGFKVCTITVLEVIKMAASRENNHVLILLYQLYPRHFYDFIKMP